MAGHTSLRSLGHHQYSSSSTTHADKPVNADIAPHTTIQEGRKTEGRSSQCKNIFLKARKVAMSGSLMMDVTHAGTCIIMYPT
jgi:hypothetical protein